MCCSMCEEPQQKTGLQHTTILWYSGSCTNKHVKFTDTSTQVLCNAKIFITVVPYLAIMVNHATKNETARITITPYLVGMVNHATKNKTAKLRTLLIIQWSWHVDMWIMVLARWKERRD